MSLANDNTIAGNQQNDDTEMTDALNGGESDEYEDDVEQQTHTQPEPRISPEASRSAGKV
jgi:hypothetical protein